MCAGFPGDGEGRGPSSSEKRGGCHCISMLQGVYAPGFPSCFAHLPIHSGSSPCPCVTFPWGRLHSGAGWGLFEETIAMSMLRNAQLGRSAARGPVRAASPLSEPPKGEQHGWEETSLKLVPALVQECLCKWGVLPFHSSLPHCRPRPRRELPACGCELSMCTPVGVGPVPWDQSLEGERGTDVHTRTKHYYPRRFCNVVFVSRRLRQVGTMELGR